MKLFVCSYFDLEWPCGYYFERRHKQEKPFDVFELVCPSRVPGCQGPAVTKDIGLSDSHTQLMQKGKSILWCILGFRGWFNSQCRCMLWYRARRLLLVRQMQVQWASQIILTVPTQTNRCCWACFLCVGKSVCLFCRWMHLTVTFAFMRMIVCVCVFCLPVSAEAVPARLINLPQTALHSNRWQDQGGLTDWIKASQHNYKSLSTILSVPCVTLYYSHLFTPHKLHYRAGALAKRQL